jgi:FAD/FMN-containing dehydrogenase
MGGGHGWLQGQYGLPADQVVSARLVLPNGDLITVSDTSHPDLLWAVKGAGHNFGLITEWEYRVYDMKDNQWSYEIFIYSGDKLEALYGLTNSMMKDQPAEAIHWGYIIKVAEIDPKHVSPHDGNPPDFFAAKYVSSRSFGLGSFTMGQLRSRANMRNHSMTLDL